jgi:hypothetical protein
VARLGWSGAFGVVLLRLIHILGKVLVIISVSLSLTLLLIHSLTQTQTHSVTLSVSQSDRGQGLKLCGSSQSCERSCLAAQCLWCTLIACVYVGGQKGKSSRWRRHSGRCRGRDCAARVSDTTGIGSFHGFSL